MIMNWVFESYSSVYQTAMMQDVKSVRAPKAIKVPLTTRIMRAIGRG
jgi:hypothetical protein